MAKLERIYTIPLGDAYAVSRNGRVPRAVKILKTFMARHMKAEDERLIISEALNKHLWVRSIQKPPRRVKVRLVKDEGSIHAYLADEKVVEKKAKAEEKKEEKKAEPKKEEKKEPPKAASPESSKSEHKPQHGHASEAGKEKK